MSWFRREKEQTKDQRQSLQSKENRKLTTKNGLFRLATPILLVLFTCFFMIHTAAVVSAPANPFIQVDWSGGTAVIFSCVALLFGLFALVYNEGKQLINAGIEMLKAPVHLVFKMLNFALEKMNFLLDFFSALINSVADKLKRDFLNGGGHACGDRYTASQGQILRWLSCRLKPQSFFPPG